MKNLTLPVILTVSVLAIYPVAAQAQDTDTQSEVVKTAQLDVSMIEENEPQKEERIIVVTPVQPAGTTAVSGTDGDVYFNHTLAPSELTEVDYNVDVVDTYTYEYNGRIYTNKVVESD